MMYVPYPSLAEQDRVVALPALTFAKCCELETVADIIGDAPIKQFELEMLAGRPVLRILDEYGSMAVDLRRGEIIDSVSQADASRIAADYAAATAHHETPTFIEVVDRDQWTVTGAYDRYRPMYRFALDDAAGTQLYISSVGGEVVLDTTARERFWNWIGAVTHWLYPMILRQHAGAWAQTVIWLSLIGTFLTLTGLWLGITQLRWTASGPASPYRGIYWWHHVSGLVFGILALTWVASGLISMNPWGFLEDVGMRSEQERIHNLSFDTHHTLEAVRHVVELAEGGRLPPNTARIASAPFDGHLYLIAHSATTTVRFDAMSGDATPLTQADLDRVAKRLDPSHDVFETVALSKSDRYYYDDHDGRRSYPAYRVTLNDPQHTRYYFDAASGELLQKTDQQGRWYRWLFQALHRWDFAPALLARPVWDLIVLPLLLGVTGLCLTGVYVGFRRVRRMI